MSGGADLPGLAPDNTVSYLAGSVIEAQTSRTYIGVFNNCPNRPVFLETNIDLIFVQFRFQRLSIVLFLQDPLEFLASDLRKFFKMGDHVKVITGRYEGDTG